MTATSDPTARTPQEERAELLRDAFEGEVMGDAIFEALAEQPRDDRTRQACLLLQRVEAVTGDLLLPLVERHAVHVDRDDLDRRASDAATLYAAKNWTEFWTEIVPLAEDALKQFLRLRELSDEKDAPSIRLLVAHEEALLEFARRELGGDDNATAPLAEYLSRTEARTSEPA